MNRKTAATAVVAMVTLGVAACVGASIHLRTLSLVTLSRTEEPALASLKLMAHQDATAWLPWMLGAVLVLLPALVHAVVRPRAGSGWVVVASVAPLLLAASVLVGNVNGAETWGVAGVLLALAADASALVVAWWGGMAARIELELARLRST